MWLYECACGVFDVCVCVVYVCGEYLFGEGVNGFCVFVCVCVLV